ncbi:MAG: hypothetical protein JNL90_12975 [Planctomycetes bacterium]|nr:hypothetical protein [Planctomycetota bacterium]
MSDASPPSSWDPTQPASAAPESGGFVRDFLRFAWEEKWWWIVPMVLIVGLLGVMLFAAQGNTIAPFFYALF